MLLSHAHQLLLTTSLAMRSAPPLRMMCEDPPPVDLKEPANNVIGTALQCCCADVRGSGIGTGFYRDGFCSTGATDEGRHTVCIEATETFLAFSAAVGGRAGWALSAEEVHPFASTSEIHALR